jgi:NADPH:quinone reductase-like Zn-dependent oxidoreductase
MRTFLALVTLALSADASAAPDKMQAVEVGPEGGLSVQTRPVPRPGAGEVLVRVRAAGVNPVDWKVAARRQGMVPGTDVAGTIDSLGEGVTEWKIGEPVLGFARQSGSYAEFAVVPVSSLARKPKSLTFEQAAGIPIAAETAYRALHEAGKLAAGQTVLIHGAAGGVGSAAVQIAKARGARVIGTASPNNHDFLRSLGVDQVIDQCAIRRRAPCRRHAGIDRRSAGRGGVRGGEDPMSAAGPGIRREQCRDAGAGG